MQVTGPWKAPHIVKLDNSAAVTAAAAAAAAQDRNKKGTK
jgi:hypothetical protein